MTRTLHIRAPLRSAAWLLVALMRAAIVFAALAPAAHAQGAEGRRYSPGSFDAILITGSAQVRLAQGSQDSVFVEGGEEAQNALRLEAADGVLTIHPAGAWKFWRSKRLQIVVTSRDLRRLDISGAADVVAPDPLKLAELLVKISGAGSVRLDKLKVDRLDFNVSGAGSGQMAGSVDELNVRISGRGAYRGENLAARVATIAISGAGDVEVWATKALNASVSGIGKIDFWGSAEVTRTSSGITTWTDRGAKRPPP